MTFGSRLRPCEPAMHPACWQGYLAEDFEQTMRRPHCVPCGAVLYVRAVWCVNRRRQGRQGARASGGNRPRLLRVATAEVRQAALCSPSCRACQRASSANPFESIEPTSARCGASASSARRLRLAWQAAKSACMQPYAKMGCHTVLGAACSPRPHLAPPASPRRRLLYNVLVRASSFSHSATHVRHACGGGGSVALPDNRMRFRGDGGVCDSMLSGSTAGPLSASLSAPPLPPKFPVCAVLCSSSAPLSACIVRSFCPSFLPSVPQHPRPQSRFLRRTTSLSSHTRIPSCWSSFDTLPSVHLLCCAELLELDIKTNSTRRRDPSCFPPIDPLLSSSPCPRPRVVRHHHHPLSYASTPTLYRFGKILSTSHLCLPTSASIASARLLLA